MADVNIDAALVQQGAGAVAQEQEKLLSLTNGCICCTLREDLLRTLLDVAASQAVDYIVVEGSGISEPLPVAETFTFVEPESGRSLGQYCRLDTMVTVVDGPAFLRDFNSGDLLATRNMAAAPGDERSISQLLADQVKDSCIFYIVSLHTFEWFLVFYLRFYFIDFLRSSLQIEFSNVVLLNKCDVLSEEDRGRLSVLLASLNPGASIHTTTRSVIPLDAIINTRKFELARAEEHPMWLKEARIGEHKPETLE
jgi:G3E family GTPase